MLEGGISGVKFLVHNAVFVENGTNSINLFLCHVPSKFSAGPKLTRIKNCDFNSLLYITGITMIPSTPISLSPRCRWIKVGLLWSIIWSLYICLWFCCPTIESSNQFKKKFILLRMLSWYFSKLATSVVTHTKEVQFQITILLTYVWLLFVYGYVMLSGSPLYRIFM